MRKYFITVATLACPVIAIVSPNGIRCRPASVTKPLRSECAEKSPSKPASLQRSVFNHARTSDGSIYGELRASDEEYEVTRRRFRREVFGRIDGILAAFTPSPKRSIQSTVLPFIHSLNNESLVGLSAKILAAKSKEAGDVEQLLVEADAYIALCRRFMSRRNWEAFAQAYGAGRLQTNDRGRRLLKQLVDGAA